jgi:hypothetical protein
MIGRGIGLRNCASTRCGNRHHDCECQEGSGSSRITHSVFSLALERVCRVLHCLAINCPNLRRFDFRGKGGPAGRYGTAAAKRQRGRSLLTDDARATASKARAAECRACHALPADPKRITSASAMETSVEAAPTAKLELDHHGSCRFSSATASICSCLANLSRDLIASMDVKSVARRAAVALANVE